VASAIAELVVARIRQAPLPPPQEFFDIDDAARIVGLTPKALRCYIELGTGPRVRRPNGTGRVIRIRRDELLTWFKEERSRDA
jgi:hypothetical protein